MGRYISPADIYDVRIYGLSATVVPTSTVATYIEDSEAIIDSYISKRYSLPVVPTSLTNVPPILAKVAKDMSAYEILNYLYSQQNQNVNNWVVDMAKAAYDKLERIADDKIRIVYTGGSLASMDIGINMASSMEDVPLVFNVDSDYNMQVPNNLLDAISEARNAAG
jgi:phage gp36-like protein